MAKGKKTGGRKRGSKNRIKAELIDKRLEGETPLEYMLKVMRNPKTNWKRRDDMAKAAAPYLHAKRAPEDKTGNAVPPAYYVHPPLGEQN